MMAWKSHKPRPGDQASAKSGKSSPERNAHAQGSNTKTLGWPRGRKGQLIVNDGICLQTQKSAGSPAAAAEPGPA